MNNKDNTTYKAGESRTDQPIQTMNNKDNLPVHLKDRSHEQHGQGLDGEVIPPGGSSRAEVWDRIRRSIAESPIGFYASLHEYGAPMDTEAPPRPFLRSAIQRVSGLDVGSDDKTVMVTGHIENGVLRIEKVEESE